MNPQPSLPFPVVFPPALKGDRLRIASILLDYRGKRKLTSREIAGILGWDEGFAADVRHIITELVDQYGLSIVGDRNQKRGGYAFAESDEEFQDGQWADLSQALTSIEKIKKRLGERRFRALVARRGAVQALRLVEAVNNDL